jgi:hypothetical protein
MNIHVFLLVSAVLADVYGIPYSCDPNTCRLPNCKCATEDAPVPNPPQFIVVTFDDSIQESKSLI